MQQVDPYVAQPLAVEPPQIRRSDPAPSRLTYRLERLRLTPLFSFSLRVLLPVTIVGVFAGAWYAKEDNRQWVSDQFAAVTDAVQSRPEFQVHMMAIDGASPELAQEIRVLLPVDFPLSSFDLDLDEMRDKLRVLDPVQQATLRVRSGGVLQIEIEERVPAMLVRNQDGLTLVDDSGAIVRPAGQRSDYPDLPVVAGEAAQEATPEALTLFNVMGPLAPRLRGFERRGGRRWDVVLDKGQRIMLPEDNPVQALERVISMDQVKDLLGYDLAVVDLRLPERATLRLNDVAAETYWETIKAKTGGAP